jgi:two-component system chemotaxis response regulator CheY
MSHVVLIVDDSSTMRKILRRSLSMSNLEIAAVHEASHGGEALEILARANVDVALVDINMPQMSGLELVEHMAGTGSLQKTAVVVVSTERSEARIGRLTQLGAHYLAKPFHPEQLRGAVELALAARRAQ